jgi:hypothetical protein
VAVLLRRQPLLQAANTCSVLVQDFDRDNNKVIDIWELRLALEAMGHSPSDSDVKEILADLDENKNGTLGPRARLSCSSRFPHSVLALQMPKSSCQRSRSRKSASKRATRSPTCGTRSLRWYVVR